MLWPVSPSASTMPRIAPQVRFWSVSLLVSTKLSWVILSACQNTPKSDGTLGGTVVPGAMPVGSGVGAGSLVPGFPEAVLGGGAVGPAEAAATSVGAGLCPLPDGVPESWLLPRT